ncbi:MAG: signal peptidase I [Bacteroidales bacterium]|nr:signal peptidase I [Bacteroidales bacterium]
MKIFKQWGLPLIAAILFVLVLRMYFFSFYVVQTESMSNTLQKNNIVLIQKNAKIKQNSIVVIQRNNKETLSRCIALPNDTLSIQRGEILLNGKIFKYSKHPITKISESYILKTNSFVQELVSNKKIHFNKHLSYFGVYHINTDNLALKELLKFPIWSSVKQPVLAANIYDDRIGNFVNHFYWNKDNTGKIIIPAKGMKIKLNPYNFELYKSIIKAESGKKIIRRQNKIYINNKTVKTYTFKYNYYFVINDNRNTTNDSRYTGFVRADKIKGKMIVKF